MYQPLGGGPTLLLDAVAVEGIDPPQARKIRRCCGFKLLRRILNDVLCMMHRPRFEHTLTLDVFQQSVQAASPKDVRRQLATSCSRSLTFAANSEARCNLLLAPTHNVAHGMIVMLSAARRSYTGNAVYLQNAAGCT